MPVLYILSTYMGKIYACLSGELFVSFKGILETSGDPVNMAKLSYSSCTSILKSSTIEEMH